MRRLNNLNSEFETGNRSVETYREGRICKYPTCNQELSIYNPNKYCFAHLWKGARIDDKESVQKSNWAAKKARYKMKGKIINEKTSDVMGHRGKNHRNYKRKPVVSFLVGAGDKT